MSPIPRNVVNADIRDPDEKELSCDSSFFDAHKSASPTHTTVGDASMKRWLTDGLLYAVGSVCFAVSVAVFSTPHEIAPGGTAGLGVIANALWGVPVGTVVFFLNLPLLAAAFRRLSKRYALCSAAVIVLSSIIMDVAAPWLPPFRGERLLAALCGGLLSGFGIGLIMVRGASTGGGDIVAALLHQMRPHWSMGRLILAVDAAVIALSAAVFRQVEAALYAAIQVFVSSLLIDYMLYGRQEGRLLLVVSRRPRDLCDAITANLARGATRWRAVGGYTGEDTAVVLCAVDRTQLAPLCELVRQTDPAAFAMVLSTEQVFGKGFRKYGNLP